MFERFAFIAMGVLMVVVLGISILGDVALLHSYGQAIEQREHFKQQYEAEHAKYQELLQRINPSPRPPLRPGQSGAIGAAGPA
jgi:hypothetical protein